nr:uncharacterized protein CTRU02_05495 [Colletotrichum truncatum]KAF6793938.1 hypothetical protein CTRU02_05495 [Colletotrichum truncatum]
MAADDWVYELTSDDEADGQHSDITDSATSELNHGASSPHSQLPLVPKPLPFLKYADWVPGRSYDEKPLRLMLYTMQWKLTLDNRKAVEQTEKNLPVAPSEFWNQVLSAKFVEIINTKSKPYEIGDTTIVLSVPNDRSEDKVSKHYTKRQQIDWLSIEEQLQGWSQLLRAGKRLKLQIQQDYKKLATTGRPAGRGATAIGLAERSAWMDAELEATGELDPWRRVYQLMRCPGAPCDNGEWCWQDRQQQGKHFKLMDHHLRELVRWVQRGNKLDTHDDIPEEFRTKIYAEDQQGRDRKRKRQSLGPDSPSHAPVIIHNHISDYVPAQNAHSPDPGSCSCSRLPPLCVLGLRDDAVAVYRDWHCSRVGSEIQREHFELAYNLTMARGLDLELLYEDNDA